MNEADIQISQFKKYWEEKHSSQNYKHLPFDENLLQKVISNAKKQEEFFLDHGCGSGRLSLEIAKHSILVGFNDISQKAVSETRNLLMINGLDSMVVHSQSGQIYSWNGPQKWGSFCSHRVLHTIPKIQRFRAIKFLADGLVMNGEAIISVKSVNCSRYKLLMSEKDEFYNLGDNQTFLRKSPFRYIHYFKEDDLKEIFKNVGLSIIGYEEIKETTGNLLRKKPTQENTYWCYHLKKSTPKIINIKKSREKIKKIILFDIDGTIVKQNKIIDVSIKHFFEKFFNRQIKTDNYTYWGKTDAQIITELLGYHMEKYYSDINNPELKKILDDYCSIFIKLIPKFNLELCDGIDSLVNNLKNTKGICLGLLTGNLEKIVPVKFNNVNLDYKTFKVNAFGSDAINRNNLPLIAMNRFEKAFGYKISFEDVIIIGDTPKDIECALSVGSKIISIASGEYSFDTLRKYNPDNVFQSSNQYSEIIYSILN